jgi:hypothetical protein
MKPVRELAAVRFLQGAGYQEIPTERAPDPRRVVVTSHGVDISFTDDRGQLMIDIGSAGTPSETFPLNAVRRYLTGERINDPVLSPSGMPLASEIEFLEHGLHRIERLFRSPTAEAVRGLRRTLAAMSRERGNYAWSSRDIAEP